jgi:hypothetical protein
MTGDLRSDDGPTLEYDHRRGCYRLDWDPTGDRSVSTLVVNAVAAVSDRDHTELTPLNDVVDPGALNALFAPKHDDTPRTGGTVSFTLSEHRVTVESEGRILIDSAGGGEPVSVDAPQ